MRKRVLFAYAFHREVFKELEVDFDVTYPTHGETFERDELLSLMPNCEVFVPNGSCITNKELIDKATNLQLIANYGVGFNNIDVEYAAKKGIVVTNTPNSVLEPTAELTFALMSAVARKIGFYNNKLRTPEGLNWGLYDNLGVSMYGKTLGVYGMGRIGQSIARRALASGMRVIYHNRSRLDRSIEKVYHANYVSFEDLLAQSDYLSLNAPATLDTYHVINKTTLAKMKPNAILINAARGNLINEIDLIDALQKGQIFGAGLDVFETEPHINSRFFNLDNVVLTPHAGTQTLEARHDMQREVMANIQAFFEGGDISKVN